MPQIPSTPGHCPGFDDLKHLSSFICRCSHCSHPLEIFSDEFDRSYICGKCGQQIDFSNCVIEGEGGSSAPE